LLGLSLRRLKFTAAQIKKKDVEKNLARRRPLAALLLILPASLNACSRAGSIHISPGTLVVAQIQEPRSLNPLYLDGSIALQIDALLFSFLTTYDLHGNTIPQAVTEVPSLANGGISRDGLTYTFHLRSDIRWQDGVPLTSRDVAFTYAAIMNPKNNALSTYGYDAAAWVRTPDPRTVIVRLKYPLAPFVTYFFGGNSNYPILPAHILEHYANLNDVPFNGDPLGSGPYRLVEWERGDHMTFLANPSYYLGTPGVRRIVIDFIPDAQTILNELTTGEVNAVFAADVSLLPRYRMLHAHRIITSPRTSFGALLFNTTSQTFRDPTVRRAFAMAINRRAIVEKLTHGVYDAQTGMQALFTWAYDPTVGNVPYDPAGASALLASAGWSRGPNHILLKNGRAFVVQLLVPTAAGSVATALMIAAYERAVGIEVQLKRLMPEALTSPSGPLYNGRYQVALFGELSAVDPDARWILGCAQRAPHGFNFMRYCNARVDRLLKRAAATLNVGERKRDYAIIQRQLLADMPIDFLYHAVEIDVIPRQLRGYRQSMYTFPYTFVYQWRL
jgi:peptide/nickel transport system substrate-binding protein